MCNHRYNKAMDQGNPLRRDGADVWYVLAPHALTDSQSARHLAGLPPEEIARYDRFMQPKDRCQFLLGKVLLRQVLSQYLPGSRPEYWRFTTNSYGKPVLANAPDGATVHFNLSHADGLVACVLSRDFEVGIDVENTGRPVNLDIVRRYFAPSEVAYLEQLHPDQQQATFFRFWTLKEAYVKVRGIGLSLPLEQFAFCLEDLAARTHCLRTCDARRSGAGNFSCPNLRQPRIKSRWPWRAGDAPSI